MAGGRAAPRLWNKWMRLGGWVFAEPSKLCKVLKCQGQQQRKRRQSSSLGAAKGCGRSAEGIKCRRKEAFDPGGARAGRASLSSKTSRVPFGVVRLLQSSNAMVGAGGGQIEGESNPGTTDGPPESCPPRKPDSEFCAMVWRWILTEVCDLRRERLKVLTVPTFIKHSVPPDTGLSISVQHLFNLHHQHVVDIIIITM